MTTTKSWSSKKGIGVITAVVLTLALVAAACGSDGGSGSGASGSGDKIKLGVIVDRTGPTSGNVLPLLPVVDAAVDQINSSGGVLGKDLEVVSGDDQGKPALTPTVARKLIDQDKVSGILFLTGPPNVLEAKNLLTETKTVGVSAFNLDARISDPPDNQYIYNLANPVTDFASIYTKAFQATGVKKLAIFYNDDPGLAGLNQGLVEVLKKNGIDITTTQTAALDASDVTAQVSRITESHPDAVLVESYGAQAELLVDNTLKRLAPDLPIFSLASIVNQPDAWGLAEPGVLDNVVGMGSLSTENPRTTELGTLLKKKIGSDFAGLNAFDAQVYDSVELLAQAIKDAGTATDSQKINRAMQQIKGYKPHFGSPDFTMSFGADKHLGPDGQCGLVLVTFKNNRPAGPWSEYQPTCS